jgi:CIC family chloride channel protein
VQPWWSRILRRHRDEVLAVGLGVIISLVIVAFIWATERVAATLYTAQSPPWSRVVIPALGSLVAGYLVWRFFPDARGSGIPQTKAALQTNRPIALRTVIGKFFCCSISLGSGISLGREGPSVQMGAGIASTVGRALRLSSRETAALLPLGSAAALAAAFNTPLAAVLFTLEEVMGDLHARLIGSVVLSAASSWLVLHLLLGDQPLFRVPAYQLGHPAEFVAYALLGVAGGIISVAFQVATLRMRLWFLRLPTWSRPFQPVVGGLFVGTFAFWVPEVLGVGYASVDRALNGGLLWPAMLLLLALKLPGTVVCYASGNPGGIFGPSLLLGAMLGGLAGSAVHQIFPTSGSPGAYALVGMGTTFAGIIRTPMTSVIMIFELTRDYNIIVPLMISNLLSYWTATRFVPEQIYESLAAQDGVHLRRGASHRDDPEYTVGDVMHPVQQLIDPETRLDQVLSERGDLIVGRDQLVWGTVTAAARQGIDASATFSALTVPPAIEPAPSCEVMPHVHPDHPLDLVLHRLGRYGVSVLPVTDRTRPRLLLGEITLEDLLKAYRHPPVSR